MTVSTCFYGSTESLPTVRELRAGPLSLVLEAGDLRYVRLGDVEIVRRIHVAVRDHNWGTVPPVRTREQVEVNADTFRVTYSAEHKQGNIHFVWDALITGDRDGGMTFSMTGRALSTFRRNRIGFCVLHPIRECFGAKCRIERGNGSIEETTFPTFIASDNPFKEIAAISHEIEPGLWAETRFKGDLFETEDQRNWIDASFKTFCTPLKLPFPVEITAGTEVRQQVSLRLVGTTAKIAPIGNRVTLRSDHFLDLRRNGVVQQSEVSTSELAFDDVPPSKVPQIGLAARCPSEPLIASEIDRLRILKPAHYRVELNLADAEMEARLRRESANATKIGVPIELAITVSDRAETELTQLKQLVQELGLPICRYLIYEAKEWSTPERWIRLARKILGNDQQLYSGTTANFRELNNVRPPIDLLDGICYSIQPQEHAFDNLSLVECCAAIAETVASTRQFAGKRAIAVTPITFRKRVNPYATGEELYAKAGDVPATVDSRQMSLFGAAWTLGALRFLTQSGANSATFYETIGWRGVIEDAKGSPAPDRFPSRAGMTFPLYHVLADAAEFCGAFARPCGSADSLKWNGIILTRGDQVSVLLANMTFEPRTISIAGLSPRVRIRVLDETTFDGATTDPIDFRTNGTEWKLTESSVLELHLKSYSYVRIDA